MDRAHKKWIGIGCAIIISMFTAYNTAADGCLLTKDSFIQTFCADVLSSSTCFEEQSSNQPRAFVRWKVYFMGLKSFGQLLGTILASRTSYERGSKFTVVCGYILSCAGCICGISYTNRWFVLVTRVIMGVGNGMVIGPALVWISEIFSEEDVRGRALTSLPVSTCVGQLLAAIFVWLINDWRLSSAIMLFALPFIGLATKFGYFPDAPSFQSKESKPKKAPLTGERSALLEQTNKVNRWSSEDMKISRSLFGEESLRLRMFLCCCIFVFNILDGASAVVYYGSSIIEDAGVEDGNLAQAFVYTFNLVGTCLNILIVEQTSRKKLLYYGSLSMAMLTFCVPVLYLSQASSSVIDIVFPGVICAVLFANAFTLGPVKYLYAAEVFPSDLKTNAIQFILFTEIIASTIGSYILWIISMIGLSISFSIFSVFGLILAAIIHVFAIETLNKNFVAIDHDFITSKNNRYFPKWLSCCAETQHDQF